MKQLIFKKELVDPSTGEVIQAVAIIPETRDQNFVKIYKVFSEKFLQDIEVLNGAVKLLLWLVAQTLKLPVQSDLWIPVDYQAIAKEMKITVLTVKKYFKLLKELGYIEQFKPRQTVFRIKPEYLYKGNLTRYKAEQIDKILTKPEEEQ